MKRVAVLGSTGSIGKQALDVIRHNTDKFEVAALCAGSNLNLIQQQIEEFNPEFVGMSDKNAAASVHALHPEVTLFESNEIGAIAADYHIDIVVNGISGIAGLPPTVSALKSGKLVALANKESIVCGHHIINEALKTPGSSILPVDSEQSAIFQCLPQAEPDNLKRIILTASGGMFRNYSIQELENVTPEMALKHPVWSMGAKITVDSSTLINKGLEVMEAGWLFNVQPENVDVLIHPQSIIHSMIELKDSSIIAQLSVPDMRLAIQYALTYPKRVPDNLHRLDLASISGLTFFNPDFEKFPALSLAYSAFKDGNVLPIAYTSASEIAVQRFIDGNLSFLNITSCVDDVMSRINYCGKIETIDEISKVDYEARLLAVDFCNKHAS